MRPAPKPYPSPTPHPTPRSKPLMPRRCTAPLRPEVAPAADAKRGPRELLTLAAAGPTPGKPPA
jgi:hypothetical protein